jgi:hypothetical protein
VQSATFFREAAGVYRHLANEVLPSLCPALPADRPLEAISSVSTAMSLICLAEAQVSLFQCHLLFALLDIHQRIMDGIFLHNFNRQ